MSYPEPRDPGTLGATERVARGRGYFAESGVLALSSASAPAGWIWATLDAGGDGAYGALIPSGAGVQDGAHVQLRGWLRDDFVLIADRVMPGWQTYSGPRFVGPGTRYDAPADLPWDAEAPFAVDRFGHVELEGPPANVASAPVREARDGSVSGGELHAPQVKGGTAWVVYTFAPGSSADAVAWLRSGVPGGENQAVTVTGTWDDAARSVVVEDAVLKATGSRELPGKHFVPGASPPVPPDLSRSELEEIYSEPDLEKQRAKAEEVTERARSSSPTGSLAVWALVAGAAVLVALPRRGAR